MRSLTKADISKKSLEKIVLRQFNQPMIEYKELSDGFYNVSYLIVIKGGTQAVLKVAPPKDIDVLTYEKDIMATEVAFYERAHKESKMLLPRVYGYNKSHDIIPNDYFFMTKLEGMPLNKIGEITDKTRREVYEVLAKNLGMLHRIKGKNFGYRTMKVDCLGKNAAGALIVAVKELFKDARRIHASMPFGEQEISKLYERARNAFEGCEEPTMVHFDLWDGNIFVERRQNKWEVKGFIDFERGFWGDPAADLGQASGYIDFETQPWFLDIYNEYADQPIFYNKELKIRMIAYRFYVFLIMHVECWYRDIDGSFEGQKEWVNKEIVKVKADFEELLND